MVGSKKSLMCAHFNRVLVVPLALAALTLPLGAKEVDSFTRRAELLKGPEAVPSTMNVLSGIADKLIDRGLQMANEGGKRCDREALIANMKDNLAGKKVLNVEAAYGAFEEIVDTGVNNFTPDKFVSLGVEKKNSIYRDFRFTEATFLKSVANIVRKDDYVIGADKFGHFFGQGFTYYNVKRKKGIEAALQFGDLSEKGNMGWGVTGVYSHGDLSANYDGMRFWDRLLDKTEDGKEPYVICQKGRWVKNPSSRFDWNDYVNPAWDEGLNCNVYRNKTLDSKVALQVLKLERTSNNNLYCPVSPERCGEMIAHYGEHARHLVSPACFKAKEEGAPVRPLMKEVTRDLRCSKHIGRKTSDTLGYLKYFLGGTVKEMFRSFKHGIEKKSVRGARRIAQAFSKAETDLAALDDGTEAENPESVQGLP